MSTLGILGSGNMAEAIVNGALAAGMLRNDDINVCDISKERLIHMVDNYAVNAYDSLEGLLENSNIVLLAVKPQGCAAALKSIKAYYEAQNKQMDIALVSIVAGWSNAQYKEILGEEARVLRVMPNTPALCREGMTVLCAQNNLKDNEFAFAKMLFAAVGDVEVLAENMFEAVTGLSGSGPAYVLTLMEAMASGGVMAGLPANVAQKLAAQTFLGTAKMLQCGDRHPASLRDAVTSPGGTTIYGLYEMEKAGVRAAMMAAVQASAKRAKELAR